MGMEIEKKFIHTDLPKDLDSYEHHVIEPVSYTHLKSTLNRAIVFSCREECREQQI